MGLTNSSTGSGAANCELVIKKHAQSDKIVALAGNPNVGKSTIFNALTGLNQHTGNWPGKTISNATGYFKSENHGYVLVDIPGTYSLMAHSAEEEVARDFICFENPDIVVVVCDATCIERNLNLVLQAAEISPNVILCANLMDEAKRKEIEINLELLSRRLKMPVIATSAKDKKTLFALADALDKHKTSELIKISYGKETETAVDIICEKLQKLSIEKINKRWLALRLIENDKSFNNKINEYLGNDFLKNPEIKEAVLKAKAYLAEKGFDENTVKDEIASSVVHTAEKICKGAVFYPEKNHLTLDEKLDRIFIGKLFGYPAMALLLMFTFWLTIYGANYPSEFLSSLSDVIYKKLVWVLEFFNSPNWLCGLISDGMYRVLSWVISVMLPPMAIFFPLFTILEDLGYLPRIAFNLDKPFKKCCACGKQALTMCMGFGCNAAGVTGCRIIDSPRERLLAILTNSFVPCNGRFPALILLITIFFARTGKSAANTFIAAVFLTAIIILGILATFSVTKILSKTVLKGVPSSFVLELPPYRAPQIGKVLVRSVFDRTIFVLGRAAAIAAPAGIILWIFTNVHIGQSSLLCIFADFLDPMGKFMGLDGIILISFILGFPANEIVIPIIIMAYTASGSLISLNGTVSIREILIQNNWNAVTALCTIVFSLFHWPCSTTLITIKKETGSIKYTLLAAVLPTVIGFIICTFINFAATIFGIFA